MLKLLMPNIETYIIILIIYSFICGVFSSALAEQKGWSGWAFFFTGLFFGILGLIYSAGMPCKENTTFGKIKNWAGQGEQKASPLTIIKASSVPVEMKPKNES